MAEFAPNPAWTRTEQFAGDRVVGLAAQWFAAAEVEIQELPEGSNIAWGSNYTWDEMLYRAETMARQNCAVLHEVARMQSVAAQSHTSIKSLGRVLQLAVLGYGLRDY